MASPKTPPADAPQPAPDGTEPRTAGSERPEADAQTDASTSRRSFVAVSIAVAAVAVAPDALAEEPVCKPFLGKYRFKGGEKERAALEKAIADVVSTMNVLTRGIARDRLRESNVIPEVLTIDEAKKALTVAMDKRSYTAPVDGKVVKVKVLTGDEMDMSFAVRKDAIDQSFKGEERGRVNTFKTDAKELSLRVRVYASRLPKELVYRLTYERV
ncbi:MAG: hypothetical protein HOW73_11715 [Polyangiaceae bacterium]|nr:hypothetical protein [Polyangiaceae bacterium]